MKRTSPRDSAFSSNPSYVKFCSTREERKKRREEKKGGEMKVGGKRGDGGGRASNKGKKGEVEKEREEGGRNGGRKEGREGGRKERRKRELKGGRRQRRGDTIENWTEITSLVHTSCGGDQAFPSPVASLIVNWVEVVS